MPGFSLPGALCVIGNATPVDGGTQAKTAMRAPVSVGVDMRHVLSPQDLEAVRGVGLSSDLGFQVRPLKELQTLRAKHAQLQIDAVFDCGADSYPAQLELAVVAQLTRLIDSARTPGGRAFESVTGLLAQEAAQPGTVSDERFTAALGDVLKKERDRQMVGNSSGNEATMQAVAAVMGVVSARHRKRLQDLLARGQLDPAAAPDDQVRNAIIDVLDDTRQGQLLGIDDDGQAMALVVEALKQASRRHVETLRGLIQQLSRQGSLISDAAVQETTRLVLEDSRQLQLLGADDGVQTGQLLGQLMQALLGRKVAAINAAYDRGASMADITRLEAEYLAIKQQASMMGLPVAEGQVRLGQPRLR